MPFAKSAKATPASLCALAAALGVLSNMEAADVMTIKDWLPLVGAGVGALFGFLSGFFSNIYFERRRSEEERKSLALAFGGEIAALIKIVEIRQYIEGLRTAVEHMRTTSEAFHIQVTVKRNYFNVYESNVASIGKLAGGLPKSIAIFYTQANSVLEDLEGFRNGALDGQHLEAIIKSYQELLQLFESTITVGKEIVKSIDAKYS